MDSKFLNIVRARRSFYDLKKESPISDQEIEKIVKESVKDAPSAFNSQSARVVVLFSKNHDRLWEIVTDALKKIVPAENFGPTQERINSFKAGYGTVLFFEDQNIVHKLENDYPAYAENFPIWSQQASGIVQFIIWTALEEVGLGASLQHYSNLIEESVKKEWDLPDHWSLIAQMPFGAKGSLPGDKEYVDINHRVKIIK